jgi:short-subunit dehydrogenase
MKKILAITGGTKGIGRAIINVFASNGFDIITCSRNIDNLIKLKEEVESEFGCSVKTFVADLESAEQAKAFGDFVCDQTDTLDALINNAGIFLPGNILQEEEGVFEKQMAINVAAAYHVSRKAGKLLKKGDSCLINLCSTASFMAYTNGGSYCVSKFAILGMTKVLREELKEDKIAVTALMPGATNTSSWEGTSVPKERFIDPNEVAKTAWMAYDVRNTASLEQIVIRPIEGDL